MHEDCWQVIIGAVVAGVLQPTAALLVHWVQVLIEERRARRRTQPVHAPQTHAQE